MKITEQSSFEPCPEFTGRAVCVDVTPLKHVTGQYGEQDVFRVVFETDQLNDKGDRPCVWSRPFTQSLNEKSNFRKFVHQWFGRDLTPAEMAPFETETLVGRPANLVVVHEHRDTQIYANIAACTPHKTGEPLAPSGKFVRAQNRDGKTGQPSASPKAPESSPPPSPAISEPVDYLKVKVHVGKKYLGRELGDLDEKGIKDLTGLWLPLISKQTKWSTDDKQLFEALNWLRTKNPPPGPEDDVPF